MISADQIGYKSAMIWVNNLNYILLVILLSRYNHYRNAPYMFQRHVAVGHVGDQVQECNQNIYTFRNIYFDKYFISLLTSWGCEVVKSLIVWSNVGWWSAHLLVQLTAGLVHSPLVSLDQGCGFISHICCPSLFILLS